MVKLGCYSCKMEVLVEICGTFSFDNFLTQCYTETMNRNPADNLIVCRAWMSEKHAVSKMLLTPNPYGNQSPSHKRGIKFAALPSSGAFNPRGIRQISMEAWPFFTARGNKIE